MLLPRVFHCYEVNRLSQREAQTPVASYASTLSLPTRIAFYWQLSAASMRYCDPCHRSVQRSNRRICGVPTFAIPVNDSDSSYQYPERVRAEFTQKDYISYEQTAEFLNFNGNDLVCLQHEYGIFVGIVAIALRSAGVDGEEGEKWKL
jgi:hypothetical protein